MNTTHRFGLAAGLIVLAGVASAIAAPALPDRVVSHWNAAGQPDATMATGLALALIPAMLTVLLVVFAVIPRIDPLGENIAAFRATYDWFLVVLTAFMVVVHLGMIAFNLGYEFDVTLLVVGGVAVLFYAVGVLLTHAERNWFVGIRTPWTLSSEEVWSRTHRLGGRLFKLTAVVTLIGLLLGDNAIYVLLAAALGTTAITVIYSYYLYQRLGGDVPTADAGS